jgi:hypothetical protein
MGGGSTIFAFVRGYRGGCGWERMSCVRCEGKRGLSSLTEVCAKFGAQVADEFASKFSDAEITGQTAFDATSRQSRSEPTQDGGEMGGYAQAKKGEFGKAWAEGRHG